MDVDAWLADQIDRLTDELVEISPSEWAEEHRRLPPSVTSLPGPFSYDVAPFCREMVDCLDRRSPVRELTIMKGAQTCATVAVAESAIGYWIAHVRTAPIMFITATKELAALRMDEYITPMLKESGLSHLIQSNSDNKRKAGQTQRKISWKGGGFLLPVGSKEASGLRSASVPNLLLDELDSYPLRVGRDGDPSALADRRTAAFVKTRKIVRISTPTTEEHSRIAVEYARGDQRVFKLPCLGCGEFDEVRWRHDDSDGVQKGGIVWAMNEHGNVEPGSVRYACRHCGHCHINEDKRNMLPRGRWEATAVPAHPSIRSYHVTALISPADFYSWEHAVIDWLRAWNVETKKSRDDEKLQEFYNNVLGRPFRISGARLTWINVARHVREYNMGQVPNEFAREMCGDRIGFLTAAVDVHDNFLAMAVYAWGPNRVGFLVAYHIFEGDCSDPFTGPWLEVAEVIDTKYHDGVDREYPIKVTVVDSGYGKLNSEVYSFCAQYSSGVYPLKGDDVVKKGATREFQLIKEASKSGADGFLVNVNHYKARLAAVLRASPRPSTEAALVDSVSFPKDVTEKALMELTAEEFVKKGKSEVWYWRRVRQRNELWDLTVYCAAARDIAAWMLIREHLEEDILDWSIFWPLADRVGWGWAEAAPLAGD